MRTVNDANKKSTKVTFVYSKMLDDRKYIHGKYTGQSAHSNPN